MTPPTSIARIHVIDSHTGGEPTRVVIEGGPQLSGTLAQRARQLQSQHGPFRSAVVNEPRGSDVLVGALLTSPTDPACTAGVIFFNNVGVLGMCGHGTIGLMVTLAWLGRIPPGQHRIETPVGIVTTELHDPHTVSVRNVPAYAHVSGVVLDVEGHGRVTGDVAWGGNWFFLVSDHGQRLTLVNAGPLADFCWRVRHALARAGITGRDGAEIDHVELFDVSPRPDADSRNFVLCPGGAYDRSPCGTGTSAKLACLHASGKLRAGERWRQESITGSVFEACFELEGDQVLPTIKGSAWVNGEATLLLDPSDPHCWGISG
jgi:4-hydroxyproline epimerase